MEDMETTLAILREAINGLRQTGRIYTPTLASVGVKLNPEDWRRLSNLASEAQWAESVLVSQRNMLKLEARLAAKADKA